MYLKKIAIKNIGPIEELFVELPFTENGSPKPIIFVGENGTGKTILQSQIIDSIYEIGNSLFEDIGIQDGLRRRYFKISGGINLQSNKEKGFSILQFSDNENKQIEYFDKIGEVTKKDFSEFIREFALNPNPKEDPQKEISIINDEHKKKLQKEWSSGVHFYQPAYRFEEPFWKNESLMKHEEFKDKKRFSNRLNKELEIISSGEANKSFLMDLVLDFTNDKTNFIDRITWYNINNILREIKKRNDIRFGIGPRGGYRVSIVILNKDGIAEKQLLPSIDNLSLGESILFNLFVNIIRHGDNPQKKTMEIEGIVMIDEIDVHLHTDLQNTVLPELLKLFPKIQFIIATHSPLFLLGMKKTFGEENFEVRNMPNGEKISTDRFSEFENAYKVLKETEKFEEEIKQAVAQNTNTIIYVEGPTDVLYIKKAYELYSKKLEGFDIQIIGTKTITGTRNSNNKALSNAHKLFSTNLNLLNKKVILLNDPEEDIEEHNYEGLLFIRKIQKFEENPLQKGIENLFEQDFIVKIQHKFKNNFSYLVKAGIEQDLKIDNNKQSICNWICENGTKQDFKNFEHIFDIIDTILQDK